MSCSPRFEVKVGSLNSSWPDNKLSDLMYQLQIDLTNSQCAPV
jgi:hypothetical protein